MKSDIAVSPVVVGERSLTRLGTLVPFVIKQTGFSADNGWEESKAYGLTGSVSG